jgi:uncharacterized protein YidB (DUF937 family)
MSLFTGLASAVLEGFEGHSGMTGMIAQEVMQHLQQNGGSGLTNMLSQLSQKGLSEAVQSWVGSGQNQAVNPQQLMHALDGGMLQQLAAKFGIPPEMVSQHLAEILPKMVDRLTPDGRLPTDPNSATAGPVN